MVTKKDAIMDGKEISHLVSSYGIEAPYYEDVYNNCLKLSSWEKIENYVKDCAALIRISESEHMFIYSIERVKIK